jgi:hypothetical protein
MVEQLRLAQESLEQVQDALQQAIRAAEGATDR